MNVVHVHEDMQDCVGLMQIEPKLRSSLSGTDLHWDHNQYPPQDRIPGSPADVGEKNAFGSNAQAIEQLEAVGRVHRYPARTAIFHHGDPANSVYIVRKGKLKLSLVSRKGRCVVFRFAAAGDLLGLSAVLNHTDHEFLAQTLEPGTLVDVPRRAFLRLLHTSYEVHEFATQRLALDHKAMLSGIRLLGMSASVRERLAQLLLNCLQFPQPDSLPLSIRMNWTYGELADMVNSSRETVTREMRRLEREELIARRGSLVVIRNQSKLKILAG